MCPFPSRRARWLLLLVLAAGCGGGAPLEPDAGLLPYTCQARHLTDQAVCSTAPTAKVSACSIDPATQTPSQDGWLEVDRADGSRGYICSRRWEKEGGFYFIDDREHLHDSADDCCNNGQVTIPATDPVTDPHFGTLHGPTHIKTQEMLEPTGGDLRHNPFAVVVASPEAAAVFRDHLATWKSWAGDGQPHPAPDGTGAYYFPEFLPINYVVIPAAGGDPVIVLGPEPSLDPDFKTPIGHPTLGACPDRGGAPMAFIAGDLLDGVLSNSSGRFGHETTVGPDLLDNTADLFRCYGIEVTGVDFVEN
jgi:hypothetical protein